MQVNSSTNTWSLGALSSKKGLVAVAVYPWISSYTARCTGSLSTCSSTPHVSVLNKKEFNAKHIFQDNCLYAITRTQGFIEGFYRVNLVDEHAEVCYFGVVPTEVGMARFHATVVCFLDFLRGCIWHLEMQKSGVIISSKSVVSKENHYQSITHHSSEVQNNCLSPLWKKEASFLPHQK